MLNQKTLKKLVHYDPITGIVTWLRREETTPYIKTWNIKYAGKRLENRDSDGYLTFCIRINGKNKLFPLHRIAWLYVYGEFPKGPIDHINRIKSDNRLTNLRIANTSLNCHNIDLSIRNKSGVKGVHWFARDKKWQAQIRRKGKPVYLGRFDNIEDAEEVYKQASLKYAQEFSIHYGKSPLIDGSMSCPQRT
jgi:hypothetical protein